MPAAITISDVQAFLKQKGVETACPLCHKTDWALIGDETSIRWPFAATDHGRWSATNPESLELTGLCCLHCGFIRQHVTQLIRDWKTQDGKQ